MKKEDITLKYLFDKGWNKMTRKEKIIWRNFYNLWVGVCEEIKRERIIKRSWSPRQLEGFVEDK